MPDCPIDLTNQEECHNYLMAEFPRFNILFEDIKALDIDAQSPANKMFIEELFSFYFLSHYILDIYKEEDHKKTEFKQMSYPVIRRLLERFFNLMYIFSNPNEVEKRYKSYLKSIELQYNKMLKDLSDNDYHTKGLPAEMHKYDTEQSFPSDLRSMLLTMENDHLKPNGKKYKLDYLYPPYRILSFYAHGNMSNAILNELSSTNDFSSIKIPEIVNMIANHYNCMIGENWPDILKNKGFELG